MENKDKNTELLESIQKETAKIDELKKEVKEAKEKAHQALENQKKLSDDINQVIEDGRKKNESFKETEDRIKAIEAKAGRIAGAVGADDEESTVKLLQKGFKENFDKIKSYSGGKVKIFETKTVGNMTSSTHLGAGNVPTSYAGTAVQMPLRKVHFRDLVTTTPSETGIWQFYSYATPVGEGSFAVAPQGTVKQQIDSDVPPTVVTLDTIAAFLRIANQMLDDLPWLQNYLAVQMRERYLRQESASFFAKLQTGATGDATTSASVTAEKIIDYITNAWAADFEPNAIVVPAAVYGAIMKTKPNDYSTPGGYTLTANGISIQGIPVVISNNVTASHVIVGDFSGDKISIITKGGINFGIYEQDSDNIQRNLVTARLECRSALAILDPAAFIYGAS